MSSGSTSSFAPFPVRNPHKSRQTHHPVSLKEPSGGVWMRRRTSQGAGIAPCTIRFADIAPLRLDHLPNPPILFAFSPCLLCKNKFQDTSRHCCALTRHQLPTSHSSPRLLHAALKKKLREELNILPKTSIFVEFRFGDDEDWTEVPRPRTISNHCGFFLPKARYTGSCEGAHAHTHTHTHTHTQTKPLHACK
jgi:hypothetical protein